MTRVKFIGYNLSRLRHPSCLCRKVKNYYSYLQPLTHILRAHLNHIVRCALSIFYINLVFYINPFLFFISR